MKLVIGAGIIGSSVVYHLSKLGHRIKWFDPMPHGWFSTSKAAGLILHGKTGPKYPMTHETIKNIRTLETELNENLGFVNCGSITSSQDHNKLDGYIDPIILAGAYKRASTNHISVHKKAEELILKDNAVIGVRTDHKEYFGDVIDCGGSWMGNLAIKSNIIQHKSFLPVRSHYFHVNYGSTNIQIPILLMNGLYIRHNQKNKYIIGIREKESYYSTDTLPHDWQALDSIKTDDKDEILIENYDNIKKVFSDMDKLEITNYTAGFSNYTPDGNYLVGKVCDGLYFAGGDCGSGISSSGGIGKMVANKQFIDEFNPLRFADIPFEKLIANIIAVRGKKC